VTAARAAALVAIFALTACSSQPLRELLMPSKGSAALNTGLREYDPQSQTLRDKPAFAAFVESARRHQACVKNSSGVCQ
jgi:hypothetical protein